MDARLFTVRYFLGGVSEIVSTKDIVAVEGKPVESEVELSNGCFIT